MQGFFVGLTILNSPGTHMANLSNILYQSVVPTFSHCTPAHFTCALITRAGVQAALKRKSAQSSVTPVIFLLLPFLTGEGRKFPYHGIHNLRAPDEVINGNKLLM